MLPIRIVRSKRGLEIKLACKVKEWHVVRSSNLVVPGLDTLIQRHYSARISQSFSLIKTAIDNEIGIADITMPPFWIEYAPQKYIYVGVHGLFWADDYYSRCRLRVGGQIYNGNPDKHWYRHLRSTWLIHLIMITEGFEKKKDRDLQDVTLETT